METKHQHAPIPALLPRGGRGHQFVCYADSCSGVPGAPHAATFAAVNRVVARLEPAPEFICFPGDEIIGLVGRRDLLEAQWRHWFDVEMAWLDRARIPLYHTPGNHTVYDEMSEAVYRAVMAHLPENGPPGQEGLSYFVRRGDLLLVFLNTLDARLGGEGRVDVAWLDDVLSGHADARHKFVFGHHPVYSVNGFAGSYQRDMDPDDGRALWAALVRHGVIAYVCSHILAFDVQVHDGVLQILTAGAGTRHRMPEEVEYLHCVQAAVDDDGLRYQVLDRDGAVCEWLTWPWALPASASWQRWAATPALSVGDDGAALTHHVIAWRFTGRAASSARGEPQTLLCAWDSDDALASLWIGLRGREQRLCVLLSPEPGRSPHLWLGPELPLDQEFDIQVALHTGMGPGGILWRWDDRAPWSSLHGAAAWGADRLAWPETWAIGHGQTGAESAPFRGEKLAVAGCIHALRLWD